MNETVNKILALLDIHGFVWVTSREKLREELEKILAEYPTCPSNE